MGLILSVYRSRGMDCSNGGISSHVAEVCAVNIEGPFEPNVHAPAVLLEMGPLESVRLVPAVKDGTTWKPITGLRMFGGNYAAASDSRYGEAVRKLSGRPWYGAVALHDRFEG